jgi:hypothetical protein
VSFSVIPENGGRRVEYHATLTMAKELAAGLQAVRGAMEKLGPEINALNFEEIENGYIDARGRQ